MGWSDNKCQVYPRRSEGCGQETNIISFDLCLSYRMERILVRRYNHLIIYFCYLDEFVYETHCNRKQKSVDIAYFNYAIFDVNCRDHSLFIYATIRITLDWLLVIDFLACDHSSVYLVASNKRKNLTLMTCIILSGFAITQKIDTRLSKKGNFVCCFLNSSR